jgi:hypothetical protein
MLLMLQLKQRNCRARVNRIWDPVPQRFHLGF